jgi:hypothetical protein
LLHFSRATHQGIFITFDKMEAVIVVPTVGIFSKNEVLPAGAKNSFGQNKQSGLEKPSAKPIRGEKCMQEIT